MFPELDMYNADPAQPLKTAGEQLEEEIDYLDHDHLSAVRKQCKQSPIHNPMGYAGT